MLEEATPDTLHEEAHQGEQEQDANANTEDDGDGDAEDGDDDSSQSESKPTATTTSTQPTKAANKNKNKKKANKKKKAAAKEADRNIEGPPAIQTDVKLRPGHSVEEALAALGMYVTVTLSTSAAAFECDTARQLVLGTNQ